MKDTFINMKKHSPIQSDNKHQSTGIQGITMNHSLQIGHKQINLFKAPVKTPLTYLGRNQMNNTQMPNHLKIKLNKGFKKHINKSNTNTNANVSANRINLIKYLNEVHLPKINNNVISFYQSQSKSPLKKRDFTSSLRKKVNQSQALAQGETRTQTQTQNQNQTEALVRTQTLSQTQTQNKNQSQSHSQAYTQALMRTKTQSNSQTTTHTRLLFNININNNNNNNNNNNVVNETSATTSAEEKHGKINKMNILFEFEKSTLIIQKIFKGWLLRKKLPKLKDDLRHKVNNYNFNDKSNAYANIIANNNNLLAKNINNIDILNKDSKSRLRLLDVNENDVSLSHSLSNVSRLSINTQDLNYDSGDNDDFVNIDDDDISY